MVNYLRCLIITKITVKLSLPLLNKKTDFEYCDFQHVLSMVFNLIGEDCVDLTNRLHSTNVHCKLAKVEIMFLFRQ